MDDTISVFQQATQAHSVWSSLHGYAHWVLPSASWRSPLEEETAIVLRNRRRSYHNGLHWLKAAAGDRQKMGDRTPAELDATLACSKRRNGDKLPYNGRSVFVRKKQYSFWPQIYCVNSTGCRCGSAALTAAYSLKLTQLTIAVHCFHVIVSIRSFAGE